MTLKWLLIVFLCLFFLTGCWDQRELSDISIVTGIAVDKVKNAKYKLTIEGIISQELSPKTASGNAPSLLFTLEGNTLSELTQKMNIGVSKNLTYSHMRILVIDEKIAREGMLDFLDFLERNREVRGDFNLIITHGVRASDILGVTYPLQKASTIKLHNQLDSIVQNWGGDPDVQLNDVIKAWISPGRDPVMAAVSIKGDPKKGLSTNNMKKVRPDAIVVADSLGVFKKNRLKGFLTLEDTRNYLFTQNKISHTALSVPCGKNKFIAIRIFNSKTKTNAKMVKGVPVINMKINSEAYLDGMQCPDDINQIKTYLKYEQLTEKKIKKMITATIQKAQKKYQADIFGFGEVLYRHNNQDFKKVENKWDDYFKNAIVNIDVNVVIRRTGNRTRSLISSIK